MRSHIKELYINFLKDGSLMKSPNGWFFKIDKAIYTVTNYTYLFLSRYTLRCVVTFSEPRYLNYHIRL
jgi:hypothetical protein